MLKFIIGLLVFFVFPMYVLQANAVLAEDSTKNAQLDYNECNRLFNYIEAKGKTSDFAELLKKCKKGIQLTKSTDFKNLSGLQFLTGMCYKIQVNVDSTVFYLKNSISNAQRGNLLDFEITSIQQINYLYRYIGKVEETDPYIKRLTILSTQVKDVYLHDKIISALTDDFLHRGAYTKAVELLLGSLSTKEYLYKKRKDAQSKINLGLAFSELGSLYLQLNQNNNALSYLKKGEPYFNNYTGGRIRLYKKMQQAYLNLSKIDSAKVYYDKIYATMQPDVYESSEDLSNTNRLFAEFYLSKKNMPKAVYYANIAYEKGKIALGGEAILMATYTMANLKFAQHNYQETIYYLEKALPSSTKFSKEVYAKINYRLAQCYQKIGNYKKANIFYNVYNSLNDDIYAEKTKEGINAVEFKYKTAQKEQQISFLNAHNKTQSKQLLQQKKYQLILIISVVLTVIIAGLIYLNYRNKKKINLLLDKKNQQLDSINAQLNNANLTKAKLFSIISHDLRSPVSQLFTFLRMQQVNPNQISEEEKKQHQQKLMQSATNLLSTMEDLLLWSKSQMEHFELDIETIAIQHLFDEAITLMQNQAEAKNLEIKTGNLELKTLQSDENLLIIVLRNLLQNAINHAYANTSILLNAGLNEDEKNFISILNKGELIPEGKIDELLNNQNVKSKSTGYGLVIVKELLQKLNGTLQISSTAEGTQMKITFS